MNKSVLIIGGAGFFGQSLFEVFQKSGAFNLLVCGDIVNPSYEGIVYENLDLLNADNVYETIAKYDIIVNCAGQITNPINSCLRLNTEGVQNIVNAIKGTKKKLIQISTVVVYGSAEYADEDSILNPETPYSAAKAFAEFLIQTNLSTQNYCIVRISNLYGNRQTKGIFNYLFKSFESDKKLEFNNNGELVRYYLHVKDAASIIFEITFKNISGRFNLLGKDQFTVKKLVELFEEVKACKFLTSYENSSPYDNCKTISELKIEKVIPHQYIFNVRNYIREKI